MRAEKRSITKILVTGSVLIVITTFLAICFLITQPLLMTSYKAKSLPHVDSRKLRAHVEALSTEFLPRDWRHPENLDRAAAYIRDEFSTAGGAVQYQNYEMEGKIYRNVISHFGPASRERIIVGAHYDAFGAFPGADDNASGVAGLLELARLLGNVSPPIGIEIVAFTLEEPKESGGPGLFRSNFGGSAKHAHFLKEQRALVKVAMVLEMIGYFNDEKASQNLPFSLLKPFYPSLGNFIAVVGKIGQGRVVRKVKAAMRAASALPVHSLNGPAFIRGVDWSDHLNYWEAGFPAVMITDTSFYRNKFYHTAGDTADRLDYERMAMVVQGVYEAVLSFADGG